ncbi:BTAD domain-containing putative transcriptional regulator [Streptomyces sp. DSM 42041]|uniref:BTAD domain-containing putative transcriptional regulator n=1 Tax=Streptomyces hazeniae TaxID=3075538 RepID=A0ABU2NQU6_9ACTN|nr:BTAD domain-containing putative transcriptional regulator [Streptomyces sp. DSM 42041]MDT0379340.1 BTAD domain-containing putative transcriptional regulator [Streptomyces sp. DSM 42041]
MGAEGHSTREPGQRDRLRFTVLGPVLAWRGEDQLPTGSPQQKALLAALLLHAGRTATAERLIDGLWGEDPPDQAKAAVRTYASRLRKALGPDAEHLVSESGGYALRVRDADLRVDLDVAAEYAEQAEKAEAAGDPARARQLYDAALQQWTGESLAHVPGPYAQTQRARLEEWRLTLAEHGLDLDLQVGCHADAVSELTALTAAHPLRERLRELLMLALYRSGRQAEALAVYADTRRLLADELGVDPRPELSELQRRILEADDGLRLPGDAPAATSGEEPEIARPAQLPATVPDFTGRAGLVAELDDELATAEGTVMAVSAVAGIGGVGKTTLAVHVAHAAREHFPDGQLYVDLQGAGPSAADPEAVLGAFLRALGTPDPAIPDGVEERAALFRSRLAGRRVLTLLDNARDAAQVRPLLPGAEGCAALVTSRTRMVDLAGAHLVDLDVMSPEEAMTLFTRIVGAERVNAERQAAMDVVAACGFLPLAIRIAAARLAARRTWTVDVLASKLADERRRLDELQAGDQAVKATFELGYSQLDKDQARAFRLLGLADGPDIALHAAAALLDREPAEAEDLLESLVDTSLLESAAPGRYRFHDLLRLYARQCAERDEQPPAERDAALSRLLDFYLATAAGVYALDQPGERLVDHLAPTDRDGLRFPDQATAVDWLFAESACYLACARQLASGGTLERAVDLLMVTTALSEAGMNIRAYEETALALREAACRAGAGRTEARARSVLTGLYLTVGRFDEADEEARVAGVLGLAAQDPIAEAYALNDRGIVANCQNRFADAEEFLSQALDCFRADRNEPSVASALCNLARARLGLGRTESAVELSRQAVDIYSSLAVTTRLGNGLYALGMALTAAGRYDDAKTSLDRSLEVFRQSRQRLWEGMAHFRLAELHLADGEHAAGAERAEQALAIVRHTGGSWRHADALTVLGRCLDAIGHNRRAQACWEEALGTYEESGSDEAAEVRALLETAVAV